jgi:hypothetical protein
MRQAAALLAPASPRRRAMSSAFAPKTRVAWTCFALEKKTVRLAVVPVAGTHRRLPRRRSNPLRAITPAPPFTPQEQNLFTLPELKHATLGASNSSDGRKLLQSISIY